MFKRLFAASTVMALTVVGCMLDEASSPSADAGAPGAGNATDLEPFSFFVTSLKAMRELSKSQNGFGGDLRYGKTDGLSGADAICSDIAETSMPGARSKTWRAFLSVSKGPDGNVVHAIDRIGSGPWYDRLGRVVASNTTDLQATRPNADIQIKNDLPNEEGVLNHRAGASGEQDNHDVLTGSDGLGQLAKARSGSSASPTCGDWTDATSAGARPIVGHSWPGDGVSHWVEGHSAPGCAAGVVSAANLGFGAGQGTLNCNTVGCQGGYGAIYCFALSP